MLMLIVYCFWLFIQFGTPFLHQTTSANFFTKLYGNGKPVEIKFEPSGKVFMAEQNDKIEDIAKKAGVNIPFKCRQASSHILKNHKMLIATAL